MQFIGSSQLRPGDILVTRTSWNPILSAIQFAQGFANTVFGTKGLPGATHASIYTGHGRFVESLPQGTAHSSFVELAASFPRSAKAKVHCDFTVYRLAARLHGRFEGTRSRRPTRALSESIAEVAAMCALTVHYLRKTRDPSLAKYSLFSAPFSVFAPESLQALRDMLPPILARLIPGAPMNPWEHGVRNIICSQFVMLMFHAAAEAKGVDWASFCPPSHFISPAGLEAWLIGSPAWRHVGTIRVNQP